MLRVADTDAMSSTLDTISAKQGHIDGLLGRLQKGLADVYAHQWYSTNHSQ